MVLLGLLLDSSVVVWLVGSAAHGSILVAGAALARHWAVQRRVQVRWRVRPGIPNRVRHVENKTENNNILKMASRQFSRQLFLKPSGVIP
jgi:hypothetical protein